MDYNNWQATTIAPIDETHRIEVYTNQKTGSQRFVPVYTRDGAHWHRYKNRETFVYFTTYGAAVNFLRRHSTAQFQHSSKVLPERSASMDEFEAEVISSYSLQQAIADGTLVEVFKNRWSELSDGIPIVVTASIADDLSFAAAREIWNEFVQWKQKVEPTLPEEERLFSTKMNGKDVWVIYDGSAYTILYPEDY